MDLIIVVLVLIGGAVLGSLSVWLFTHGRTKAEFNRGCAQGEAERGILLERLQARENLIAEGKQRIGELESAIEQVHGELKSETERRSKAEERNLRISELEIQITSKEHIIEDLGRQCTALKEKLATLQTTVEKERSSAEEKLAIIEKARTELSDAFKALSSDALKSNNASFLELAKTTLATYQESAKNDLDRRQTAINELVTPLKDSLEKVDNQVREIEKSRAGAYSSIELQLKSLADSQVLLRNETTNLVKALRAPTVRGRWGEIQLRRVVEMAGMLNYCDFVEQASTTTEESRLRPDLIVKLPNNKNIVVDAKTPLQAYLDALEAPDEAIRIQKLKDHAAKVREHVTKLSAKAYWDQF
jgi:DNA recombination protein RmuC